MRLMCTAAVAALLASASAASAEPVTVTYAFTGGDFSAVPTTADMNAGETSLPADAPGAPVAQVTGDVTFTYDNSQFNYNGTVTAANLVIGGTVYNASDITFSGNGPFALEPQGNITLSGSANGSTFNLEYQPVNTTAPVISYTDPSRPGEQFVSSPSDAIIHQVSPGPNAAAFTVAVSNAWQRVSTTGNLIQQYFVPSATGPSGTALTLSQIAQLGGFDHFNVEQVITNVGNTVLGTKPIVQDGEPAVGLDFPIGGVPSVPADNFPWTLNEVSFPGEGFYMWNDPRVTTSSSMMWWDSPDLHDYNAGATMDFTDYLVGVYSDGTGVVISDLYPDVTNTNFDWQFTQGIWGLSTDEYTTLSDNMFPTPGSDGSVQFDGYFGASATAVPEPLTLSLFGAGLAGLFFTRRRKKAAA